MPEPVRIRDIVDGMEMQSDEMHSYLRRSTGEVITISDEALADAETENESSLVSEAELAAARGIVDAGGDYLPLPDRFEINEYRMMERFARRQPDDRTHDELSRALHGRGAFRHFKDTVHRIGLADAWYAYRDECYREIAREWCAENRVEAVDDPAPDEERR